MSTTHEILHAPASDNIYMAQLLFKLPTNSWIRISLNTFYTIHNIYTASPLIVQKLSFVLRLMSCSHVLDKNGKINQYKRTTYIQQISEPEDHEQHQNCFMLTFAQIETTGKISSKYVQVLNFSRAMRNYQTKGTKVKTILCLNSQFKLMHLQIILLLSNNRTQHRTGTILKTNNLYIVICVIYRSLVFTIFTHTDYYCIDDFTAIQMLKTFSMLSTCYSVIASY